MPKTWTKAKSRKTYQPPTNPTDALAQLKRNISTLHKFAKKGSDTDKEDQDQMIAKANAGATIKWLEGYVAAQETLEEKRRQEQEAKNPVVSDPDHAASDETPPYDKQVE